MERTMRQLWFDHVKKTRSKHSTKKEPISHREAMSLASQTWPAVKAKEERKRARAAKKKAREEPKEK